MGRAVSPGTAHECKRQTRCSWSHRCTAIPWVCRQSETKREPIADVVVSKRRITVQNWYPVIMTLNHKRLQLAHQESGGIHTPRGKPLTEVGPHTAREHRFLGGDTATALDS